MKRNVLKLGVGGALFLPGWLAFAFVLWGSPLGGTPDASLTQARTSRAAPATSHARPSVSATLQPADWTKMRSDRNIGTPDPKHLHTIHHRGGEAWNLAAYNSKNISLSNKYIDSVERSLRITRRCLVRHWAGDQNGEKCFRAYKLRWN